jgi:hypothetical protein
MKRLIFTIKKFFHSIRYTQHCYKIFFEILEEFNYSNTGYPFSNEGMLMFLQNELNIRVYIKKDEEGWYYFGLDLDDNNIFTQDFATYKTFNKCLDVALLECFAWTSRWRKDYVRS